VLRLITRIRISESIFVMMAAVIARSWLLGSPTIEFPTNEFPTNEFPTNEFPTIEFPTNESLTNTFIARCDVRPSRCMPQASCYAEKGDEIKPEIGHHGNARKLTWPDHGTA
jgi:hypothetical protein